MVKKIMMLCFMLCVCSASLSPGFAKNSIYAASADVKISTSAGKYAVGSQVQINGTSPAGKDITLKVIDNNSYIVHVDAIYAKDNNGTFQFIFTMPETRASSMNIIVGFGSGTGEFAIKKVDIGATFTGGGGGPMGPGSPDNSTNNPNTPSNGIMQLADAANEVVKGNEVTVTFDAAKITELVSKATSTTLEYALKVKAAASVVKVELTPEVLALLTSKNAASVLHLQTGAGDYKLPINQIDLAAVSKQMGLELKDVKVSIVINRTQGESAEAINAFAAQLGAEVLAAPVEFSVTVVGSNGMSQEISVFSTYIAHTIHLSKETDPNTAIGVWYNPDTNTFSPVPTIFDGLNAILYRKGNSLYSVIQHAKTFGDVAGHWAKSDVELLASKLIVNGVADSKFAPDKLITRAEFSALLVRSLGLAEVKAEGFKDVAAADWFSGSVGASQKAGLIDGYEDGTFKPNAMITREQMVTMIIRALKVSDKEVALDQSVLNKFADGASISSWSKEAVAKSITAGIVQGMTDTTFAPQQNASRAQGTVMLKRMLQYLKFIN
ncbi:S-layer homology domain-containing protein [Paenibacillus eucommiae]|uniref:SLH domain-containing protein n=1 Tax=Paenibacillus eucommiae TaxID=1355755 RepID=A0ABS4IYI5_9BACL|nr:S-layer homology domain-containing protein [Paenibacillus eucommiae]MBP1991931.1 hypothetical protein [Paenibacillus eucommiae]